MLLGIVHVLYCFIQEPSVQANAIHFKVQKVKRWEKNLMVKLTSYKSTCRHAELVLPSSTVLRQHGTFRPTFAFGH